MIEKVKADLTNIPTMVNRVLVNQQRVQENEKRRGLLLISNLRYEKCKRLHRCK
jgi:hypothetical protein